MQDHYYGEPPVDMGPLDLPDWQEFMHYLYLPIRIPLADAHLEGGVEHNARDFEMNAPIRLPERLRFLRIAAEVVRQDAQHNCGIADPYIYVTARRGYATPGAPLNRPGWHCDDFGGEDINYIWADHFPTRILRTDPATPLPISSDDMQSMVDMDHYAFLAQNPGRRNPADVFGLGPVEAGPPPKVWMVPAPTGHLLRLSPYVIHDTPLIPAPGGMRSFFKISVSRHRYDLIGNSHNHLLNYAWPMLDRAAVRNQPGSAQADHSTEETP